MKFLSPTSFKAAFCALVLLVSLPSAAHALPTIVIDSPTHGKWDTPTGVEGHIDGPFPPGSYVMVNNIVAALNPLTNEFSVPWAVVEAGFPPNYVFHPVLAELRDASDTVLDRDRVVVYNPTEFGARRVWPNKLADNAVFARLNDTAFPDVSLIVARALSAAVGPDSEDGAPNLVIPPEELENTEEFETGFPPICIDVGNLTGDILSLFSVPLSIPLGATDFCVVKARGVINSVTLTGEFSAEAAPANGVVDITVEISEATADAQLSLKGFFLVANLPTPPFWFDACNPTGGVGPVSVSGSIALEPNTIKPKMLDITAVGPLDVQIDAISMGYQGLCGVPGLENVLTWLDDQIIGRVERETEIVLSEQLPGPLLLPHASPASVQMLLTNAIDFPFYSLPISGEFETPWGGISFDAPMNYVSEGPVGLETSFNLNVKNEDTHPNAPTINHAFFVEGIAPFLQQLTPDSQPYEMAVSVHTGALNKALNAATQLGVFHFDLAELDLDSLGLCLPVPGGNPGDCLSGAIQLDSTLLSQWIPAFAALPAGTPLAMTVEPTLAPVVSMVDPVAPDTGTLYAHATQHLVTVIEHAPAGDIVWLQVALDLRAGMAVEAGFTPGYLNFDLVKDDGGYLRAAIILEHNFGSWPDETFLTSQLSFLVDGYVELELIRILETSPVPTIKVPPVESLPTMQPTSIEILPVETELANNYITVYMDMDVQ